MNNPYHLVKIMDNKWTNKLLDGEIYMRPLSTFNDIFNRSGDTNNTFRGDPGEGILNSFSNGDDSDFFRNALAEISPYISGTGFISEYLLQEKIYCLYCLEYDDINSSFIAPSEKLIDFGDTAVIIYNSWEFIKRIFNKIMSENNEPYFVGVKRVKYEVDLRKTSEYNEFSKSISYSWQNEFRIALDLSDGKADKESWQKMTDSFRNGFLNDGGEVDMNAERTPITLQIGNIRDICVSISTEDLINLKLPDVLYRFKPTEIKPLDMPRKSCITGLRPVFIVE